jgi:hypothetical protein
VILSVNLVAKRRHWRAGEEIDESEVPLVIRKYAVTVNGNDESPALEPPPPAPKRKVKTRKRAKG